MSKNFFLLSFFCKELIKFTVKNNKRCHQNEKKKTVYRNEHYWFEKFVWQNIT